MKFVVGSESLTWWEFLVHSKSQIENVALKMTWLCTFEYIVRD